MVEGTLTSWLELVDSSDLLRGDVIKDLLANLCKDDENCEKGPLVWNEQTDAIYQFSLTYWDVSPPDFAELLNPVSDELQESEYLIFEEKTRYGAKHHTVRAILVTIEGVFHNSSEVLHEILKLNVGKKKPKLSADGPDI